MKKYKTILSYAIVTLGIGVIQYYYTHEWSWQRVIALILLTIIVTVPAFEFWRGYFNKTNHE